MTERGPDFSRAGRNKNRKRSSAILNSLIGVVVVLIIIVAATIFLGNDDEENMANEELIATEGLDNSSEDNDSPVLEDEATIEEDEPETEEDTVVSSGDEESNETEKPELKPEAEMQEEDDSVETEDESAGSVTFVTSDDDIVEETIISAAWQPIGTTQSGEHASQYDRESVDWAEKQQALAYATGLSQDAMIFWKIKNGGGPQKSVGIVSSTDKAEKYRVYLEWVDGEGWKPVKMDVLKTLDFEY